MAAGHAGNSGTGEAMTVLRCAAALFGVIAFGTIGFCLFEPKWDVWESLYFTLITITTVGYGDEGISAGGKTFAGLLLVIGIGTATYAMSQLVQAAATIHLSWKERMRSRIERIANHVVVCGFGRMGKFICRRLADAGAMFVVVEQDQTECQAAIEQGYLVMQGDASEDDVLRKASIKRARAVVCVLDSDAENTFVALSAHDLNSEAFVISRAESNESVRNLERAGAALVVSPHVTAGESISSALLQRTNSEDSSEVSGDLEFRLHKVLVDSDSTLLGKTLVELRCDYHSLVVLAIVDREGKTTLQPELSTTLRRGDIALAAATSKDVNQLRKTANLRKEPTDRQFVSYI